MEERGMRILTRRTLRGLADSILLPITLGAVAAITMAVGTWVAAVA
jgi:hypothetical protein